MAQVTIDGNIEQIAATLNKEAAPKRQSKDVSRRRQQAISAKRRTVRKAFDLVRHDISRADIADRLAGALGGRFQLDQSVLDLADKTIRSLQTR